jgi:hypothetical protein
MAVVGQSVQQCGCQLWITVLIAATAYEIKLACENLDDLDELHRELEMEAVDGGLMADVCHPGLPSVEELMGAVLGIILRFVRTNVIAMRLVHLTCLTVTLPVLLLKNEYRSRWLSR